MSLRIGDVAADCSADTIAGPTNVHDWRGQEWVFFLSHPADNTPVFTTKIGRATQLAGQFSAFGIKPVCLSTDTADEHIKWIADIDNNRSATPADWSPGGNLIIPLSLMNADATVAFPRGDTTNRLYPRTAQI